MSLTPEAYALHLLQTLQCGGMAVASDGRPADRLWAESGAMWLTGHADADPRACPAPLAAVAQGAWLALCALTGGRLNPAALDAHKLLGERAAIAGYSRQGRQSAGAACQLYDCADGVLALNLARDDDRDLLPAWLEEDVTDESLADLLQQRPLSLLLERGRLLGLAVAAVAAPETCTAWFGAKRYAEPVVPRKRVPLVIDLSSLWAGPLCGQLLAQAGARVIKVESEQRPDGARQGPTDFFDLMNDGKECLSLPLHTAAGKAQLRTLILQADIVIEASRPRALEQMGIVAAELLQQKPGLVWLSLSGYGRAEPQRDWIAYGDDAGVAAGLSWLVGGDRGDPVFCGDAIADPLTGLHAALLGWHDWQRGGGRLLELSLQQVVSFSIAAGSADITGAYDVVPPQARPVLARAAALGADNPRLLQEFLP
ncbi:CoA transferase [Pseudomaricurvus sp. HS19]|uniref:CoA transferase n=1 Tax=Pseudomaricurvus sp. HS19 TaxID=2692626 RepID=UPI001371ADC9|nr:CoA transferase [Pseudomaricurvus sp. HS19]MYM64232.1 CoA transferase [Pseudomaricurvus sp. HS19]